MSEMKTNKMLATFGLVYGAPSKDIHEAKALLSEYARLLTGYSGEELALAADKVVKGRKFRTWPTLGECISVLEDERAETHDRNVPERKTEWSYPDWSNAAVAKADKLIQCDLGRRAATEGWIVGLHDYCRKNGKLPGQYEIGPMIESAEYIARSAAGAVDMGLCHKALLDFANSALEKRERLARLALGAP